MVGLTVNGLAGAGRWHGGGRRRGRAVLLNRECPQLPTQEHRAANMKESRTWWDRPSTAEERETADSEGWIPGIM